MVARAVLTVHADISCVLAVARYVVSRLTVAVIVATPPISTIDAVARLAIAVDSSSRKFELFVCTKLLLSTVCMSLSSWYTREKFVLKGGHVLLAIGILRQTFNSSVNIPISDTSCCPVITICSSVLG